MGKLHGFRPDSVARHRRTVLLGYAPRSAGMYAFRDVASTQFLFREYCKRLIL